MADATPSPAAAAPTAAAPTAAAPTAAAPTAAAPTAAAPTAAAPTAAAAARPVVPVRMLTISVALTVFISVVVYAIATFYFLAPRLGQFDLRLGRLEIQMYAATIPEPEPVLAEATVEAAAPAAPATTAVPAGTAAAPAAKK